MSQAVLYCLEGEKTESREDEAELPKTYLGYVQGLTLEELEQEVTFFINHHMGAIYDNPRMALRGKTLMEELASRVELPSMREKILEMASSFPA